MIANLRSANQKRVDEKLCMRPRDDEITIIMVLIDFV